ILEQRLVGLRQATGGEIEEIPVETLGLLRPGGAPPASSLGLIALGRDLVIAAGSYAADQVLAPAVERQRKAVLAGLSEREDFLRRGFDYQDADLALRRARLGEKARNGNAAAQAELARIRDQQRQLGERRERALAELRNGPQRIESGGVAFIAHALVVPSVDPEDKQRFDAEVEAIAVKIAWAYEEAQGANVSDVSKPALARAASLPDWPGFDLLARRKDSDERAIEVKGRARSGDIEMKENEWTKACNLRDRYWLYVVYDCATPNPRLLRVQDPFGKLIVKAKGEVLINAAQLLMAAAKADQCGSGLPERSLHHG
ncbi:MAG TPA: DUF3883 domain-containing protein, partial [Thermoanaerobaculaceae bacterium]|nr:DUF3883 domain-containing protein [Thermoanaerobaculaceae bacterium]